MPETAMWGKAITADGATASPQQMQVAWAAWMAGNLRTATTLERALERAGVTGTSKYRPTDRVADRMLQRARKAGVIRYVKGRWEDVADDTIARGVNGA